MPDESIPYSDVISRRRFVELAGVTGAAALAGCDSDGSGDTASPTDESTSSDTEDGGNSETDTMQVHDVRLLEGTNQPPVDVQFNPWGTSPAQDSNVVIFDPFAKFNYATGEYEPGIISEWEFTGDAFEMTIQEGATWHDGDPVTSEDVETYLQLDRHMGSPIWDWGGEIQTPDDQTAVITVEDDVNPALVEFAVLANELRTKSDRYADILEQLNDNPDDPTPLTEFTDEDPVGNGIFQNVEADSQVRLTRRFEDHPNADNVNFEEYAFKYLEGNTAMHQALEAAEIEAACVYAPGSVVSNYPDSVREYITPTNGGLGIIPNHDHKDLGRREVRQAIAYVLNREQIASNSDPRTKVPPRVPTALPDAQLENWLGDSMDQFETYGRDEQLTEEATAVLEDAGYTKNGDTWEDENGEPLAFELIAPGGWSDWVTPMETAADQLNAFGIDANFTTRPYSNLVGADGDWAQGEYDATAEFWTAALARAAHPYFNLMQQMVDSGAMLRPHGYNYPGAVEAQGGSAADITVPALEGDGELTVNPVEDVSTLGSTSDTDEEESLALDLLWVANQDLPMIPIQEGSTQCFINSERWDVPETDDEVAQVKQTSGWLPRQGEMQYAGD